MLIHNVCMETFDLDGMILCESGVGRSNLSKSGPYEPTFFSWMGVHALMAVRTLTLSLVKYLRDAVDFCETSQLPLRSLSVEKV